MVARLSAGNRQLLTCADGGTGQAVGSLDSFNGRAIFTRDTPEAVTRNHGVA